MGYMSADGSMQNRGEESGSFSHVLRQETHGWYLSFDASRCSDRYGSYTEVNPLYNSCKFFIRY